MLISTKTRWHNFLGSKCFHVYFALNLTSFSTSERNLFAFNTRDTQFPVRPWAHGLVSGTSFRPWVYGQLLHCIQHSTLNSKQVNSTQKNSNKVTHSFNEEAKFGTYKCNQFGWTIWFPQRIILSQECHHASHKSIHHKSQLLRWEVQIIVSFE